MCGLRQPADDLSIVDCLYTILQQTKSGRGGSAQTIQITETQCNYALSEVARIAGISILYRQKTAI